uniref:Integrase core domain containing protein n=1 Tax=Solanum tuberosum TaxID=4113 RepID=M1DNY3_SOLTU
MEAKTDHKVQAVHKRLDAFELKVLERPTRTTDMSSFRTELASLRADVDTILATPALELQVAPSALGDDTVLGALFSGDDAEEQPEPAPRGKRHRSSHKTELTEEEKASKRQRRQEERARKASIIDEQLRQQRTSEMIDGASSSMPVGIDVRTTEGATRVTDSTTDGVVLVDAVTTEGDPSVDLAGSGKLDPPTC